MLWSELHKHNKSAFREPGLPASSISLIQDITLSKLHLTLAQPNAPELVGALSRSSASQVPGTQIFPWLLSESQGQDNIPRRDATRHLLTMAVLSVFPGVCGCSGPGTTNYPKYFGPTDPNCSLLQQPVLPYMLAYM